MLISSQYVNKTQNQLQKRSCKNSIKIKTKNKNETHAKMLVTFAKAQSGAARQLLHKAQSSKRKQNRPKPKTQKPFCRFAFQFHFFIFCSTLLIAVAGRTKRAEAMEMA